MDITIQEESGYWKRRLSDRVLTFKAADLRKERTGVHARVEVYDNDVLLYWDNINIEKGNQRTPVANKAFAAMESTNLETEEEVAYPKNDLAHDLDLFCRQVWPDYIGQQGAELLHGDSTSEIGFLAKPHVLDQGGSIIFGPQGAGKSYAALLIATAVDGGVNGLWTTAQRRTMFINLERGAGSIARRISCVNGALGLEPDRPLLTLNRRGRSLGELKEVIKRDVERHKVELVVVDSISRTGVGDLNENEASNRGIDALNSLAPSWLALGHTPRDSTDHLFGSTMWDAGADVMVRLTGSRQGERVGVHLEVTKENDIGPQPAMTLAYTFDRRGLLTAEKASLSDFPELVSSQRKSLPDEIEEFILMENRARATGTAIADGLKKQRPNIVRVLKADGRFVVVGKEGTQVYYGVQRKDDYQ